MNQHCAPAPRFESMFRADVLKIVLQHGVIRGSSQTKARESALQERMRPAALARNNHPLRAVHAGAQAELVAEWPAHDAHARSGLQPAELDHTVALTFADVGDHAVGHDGWRRPALDDAAHAEALIRRASLPARPR